MPPVGSTDNDESLKRELRVELNGLDWKVDGKALAITLLKRQEIVKATVDRSGLIALELKPNAALDEKSVRKCVKDAGFKFKSLRQPER